MQATAAPRSTGMVTRVLSDFIFLKPDRLMTQHPFNCWLKRQYFGNLSYSVCSHKVEATAVEGLTGTMQPVKERVCFPFMELVVVIVYVGVLVVVLEVVVFFFGILFGCSESPPAGHTCCLKLRAC